MKLKTIFKTLLFFLYLFLIIQDVKSENKIILDISNIESKPYILKDTTFPKGEYFTIEITYDANKYKLEIAYKKKKISYTPILKPTLADGKRSEPAKSTYLMTSDAIEFTVSLKTPDSVVSPEYYEVIFMVYAKKYWSISPSTGFSFQKFKDLYTFSYEPTIKSTFIHSDTSFHTYKLKKEAVGMNINVFIGTNFNYVVNDCFKVGLSTSFGLNTNKSSVNSALFGVNFGIGRKVHFNVGGGLALAKIKTIPDHYFEQDIRAKYSSQPKVPEGIEKWKTGFYINFGLAFTILENI